MSEDAPDRTSVTTFKVKLAGQEVEESQLHGWVVDLDLNRPDMCVVTLKNSGHRFSNSVKHADALEITVGEGDTAVFKGEVCAVEPQYKTGGESKCIVRGFNRLHRLLRGRKSRTFLDQSDQDIVGTVAGDAGLSPKCDSETKITHAHVYQHNQTDLEFLRLRAARIGYEVWVDDRDLHFEPAKTDKDSGIKLKMDAGDEDDDKTVLLATFNPRMSSSGVVSKVVTRGWDPLKKEEIVGEAEVKSSKLGDKTGDKASSDFGSTVTYEVDHPIFSVEEAKAIAESRLGELIMGYISGEGSCKGHPELKPGIVVTVTVNPDDDNDKFNGKYFLVGATHNFTHSKGSGGGGGYKTVIRFARDAEGSGATTSDQNEDQES